MRISLRENWRIHETNNEKAKQEDSDDIVTIVPFDEQTITWKTDLNGQIKPSFNIANNVDQIQSKEVLCNYFP